MTSANDKYLLRKKIQGVLDAPAVVTSRLTGNGSSGSPLDLATSGVIAGTYGAAGKVPRIIYDAYGRATSVVEVDVDAVPKSLFLAKGDLAVGTGAGTVARRVVGADGTVLTADSTQTDGVKWGASGGGWQTAYDVDLTALATQDLLSGGDGAKVIDGKTWALGGSANLSVASVTNGTGIVITALNGTGGTLNFKFVDINAALQPWYSAIQVWVYGTLTVPNTNLAWAPLCIGDWSNLNTWSYFSGPRYDTGLAAFPAWVTYSVFNSVAPGTLNQGLTTGSLTDDTIVLGLTDWTKGSVWSGTYAGSAFPAFSTLKTRGVVTVGSTPSVISALPANMGFGLAPSVLNASVTVRRILVRYQS